MGNRAYKKLTNPNFYSDLIVERIKNDDNSLLQFFIINNFYNEIESSLNNNTDLNIKNLAKQLSSFCLSEKFFIYLVGEIKDETTDTPFSDFVVIYEKKERYLSTKIFFYVLEEILNEKFKKQIKEIFRQLKTEPKNLEKSYDLYLNKHKDSIIEFRNDLQIIKKSKFTKMYCQYLTENVFGHVNYLNIIYVFIIIYIFYEIFAEGIKAKNGNDNLLYIFYKNIKNSIQDKDEINNIINILIHLDSLNKTKNVQQIFLFILNNIKKDKELSLRDELNNNFFENYGNVINLDDKLVWTLYEKDSEKKYTKIILEGKMTEKEKFNFDIFECVTKIKVKEDIKGITGFLYESMFYNRTILMVKIDQKEKINSTLEQVQNEIKLLNESCPLGYDNLNIYIQIENKIINFDTSYDLFIKELKEKKIIHEDIKIDVDKTKICDIKKDCNDEINYSNYNEIKLELAKEKEKNRILEERIKQLEKELIEEKNRNKKSEELLNINLKKELDKEIKKYNDLKEEIEEERTKKINLGKETRDSMIETIIEKDKETKELKTRLSKIPFTLEEGEELMTIMFISSNQRLYYSVICKNTDEFHKIEGGLYKKYPEYAEHENFFLVKGNKVNKFKTLEQNGIKDNDVIILMEIE